MRPDAGQPRIRRWWVLEILVTAALIALTAVPDAEASVYWAVPAAGYLGTTIGHGNLDGTGGNPSFIGGASGPFMTAVDGSYVYWSSLDGTIGRANLAGTGVNQRFITGAGGGVTGVAVDGAHVYWNNFDSGTIGRANLDGSGIDQSFITGASSPCGVAVDGAHIYWSNLGGPIGRANLNGTSPDQSFIAGVSNGCGVAVDGANIFWTSNVATIGRANLDGGGANASFIDESPSTGVTNAAGVAVDGAHIYWANYGSNATAGDLSGIGRANLDGTGANPIFLPDTGLGPWGPSVDAVVNSYQADGLIKRSKDTSFIGDGTYDAGAAGQSRKFTARRGKTKVFDLEFQNDGDTSDAAHVSGCGSSKAFKVTYLQGSTNVTEQVTSGRFSTGTMPPGAVRALRLKVKVKGKAKDGKVKSCLVTATALGNPSKKDAVRGKVKVK